MYRGSSESDLVEDVSGEGLFDLGSAASRRVAPKKSSRRKPEQSVPADFAITDDMYVWAKERKLTVNLELETERFINHALQKDRRLQDWVAAWRNWMLKAQEFADERAGQGKPQGARPSSQQKISPREEWMHRQ